MGIEYSTTVFWGSYTEDLSWFLNSFAYGYDDFKLYLDECYGHPIVQASQWEDGFEKLYSDLYEHIHSGGCGYEGNGLEYYLGIKICEVDWFGSASAEFSIEQLQQCQKEYEEVREHFEMLFGIEIPQKAKLGVCVHRH